MDYQLIGELLLEKKFLNEKQLYEILKEARKDGIHKLFGRIAVEKGYISEDLLNKALLDKMKHEAYDESEN